MKLLNRIGFYLVGLSMGLVFLAFFFNGKKTSCNYGPEARVKNDFSQKIIVVIPTLQALYPNLNDSLLRDYIKKSTIVFSKSETQLDSCKRYQLQLKSEPNSTLVFENCRKELRLLSFNPN